MVNHRYLFLLLVTSLSGINAQAASHQAGKVMPKSDQVRLRVEGRIVGDAYSIAWPATVKSSDGRWLWLEDAGGVSPFPVGGWVRSDEMVPLSNGLEYFNSRLVADPSSIDAHWLRGLCWEQVNELGLAAKDYREAVKRNPWNRAAQLGLARTLAANQQYNENAFQAAWRLNPTSPRLFVDWGDALQLVKQPRRAAQMYDRAIELSPNWQLPHYAHGKLAADQRQYTEALGHYEEALRRDPSFHAVHRDRAAAWLASQSGAEVAARALTSAHKACELCFFREPESLAVLAQAFDALGHVPEARRFQHMAVEYSPFHAKQRHYEKYLAYAMKESPKFAGLDGPTPAVERSQTITEPEKARGGRVIESRERTSDKSSAEPAPESLPPPEKTPPRLPPFIDRSAFAF